MFEFCWMWNFPWIKLSWHSGSMWDKLEWLYWFWQFFCDGLSSFNLNRFYCSYAWSCSLCEGRISFNKKLISRKLCRSLLVFDWLYFTQCLTFFSSINHLAYAQFLILFHLTYMRFSRSTHLLMWLSWETLTSIIRTHWPILVELTDPVTSVIILLSKMTLLRWLTFLLESLTVTLKVLLFWIYSFLLTLALALQWLSVHWETLIMLLPQFPLTSIKLRTRHPISSHSLRLFLCWLRQSS